MKICISMPSGATRSCEIAEVLLRHEGLATPYVLDLQMSSLLDKSIRVPSMAVDLLFIASLVYAIDKIVERKTAAEDAWTRDLSVAIPVKNVDVWEPLAEGWSDCVSFLTGDRWDISFVPRRRKIDQRSIRKRRTPAPLHGDAVSLLSGGLDSFIGAIDWLSDNPSKRLVFVGHHDKHVAGPMGDQAALFQALEKQFPGRVGIVQVRAGVSAKAPETSFRSRSLIFLALGTYIAELLGPGSPVIIPENGPIALNIPLSASRRGSCSTRTVHPKFIQQINAIWNAAGLSHLVSNPYAFKTKGEMVRECRVPDLLKSAVNASVSCAKSGHHRWWHNRKADSCGRCVPCLFRRAALAAAGLDTQDYGYDVLSPGISDKDRGEDVRTLMSFLCRNPGETAMARALMCNGTLPQEQLNASVDVVRRMMDEVRSWVATKGSAEIKDMAGI